MTTTPSRRDVLRAGALALSGALAGGAVAGCTPERGGTGTATGGAGGSAAASTSPSAPATASAADLDALAARLGGGLLRPGSAGWDPAALLHNPRFTAPAGSVLPQAVARCASTADVAACVRFAAEGRGSVRWRAGGHSYSGASLGPGVVADLSGLSSITVDAAGRTATVGAGAVLVDVYAAVAAKGLALGAGSCPTVGVSGLTLGGGIGVLARSTGLTCDQVRSARVVTADGDVVVASADAGDASARDLFWALRGGGGGFGAVVEWTFALRPAPTVTSFFLQWPWSAAEQVLAAWQEWAGAGPRELWSSARLLVDPGAAGGAQRVVVFGTWTSSADVETALAPLLAAVPAPTTRTAVRQDYAAAVLEAAGCTGLDAAACRARADTTAYRTPFAATSSVVGEALPAAGIAAAVDAVAAGLDTAGLKEGGMAFDVLGGAVADTAAAATAFPWRSALATVQHTATWATSRDDADPAPYDALVHAQRAALQPWCGTSAYLNYADAALEDPARACWGPNLARLRTVRRALDPDGVFSSPLAVPLA